jgi:hypothetical protein
MLIHDGSREIESPEIVESFPQTHARRSNQDQIHRGQTMPERKLDRLTHSETVGNQP